MYTRVGVDSELRLRDEDREARRRIGVLLLDCACLQNYLVRILSRLPPALWDRFLSCTRREKHSVLARMYGFERVCPECSWQQDTFMQMLLDNENLRHPRVWLSTWVAMPPPDHLVQIPHVAEWIRDYTELSAAPRLTVVVTRGSLPEVMRYEEWILWEPCLREQRVLAYRSQPCGVCACCGQPSIWKIPRGRRGCAASIMRTVGPMVSGRDWPEMTCLLSRSRRSPLEQLLLDAVVNTQVFETLFLDVHCLSCSCGKCSLKDMRAGIMCPHDQTYVEQERAGPESPRDTCHDFSDNPREMFSLEDFPLNQIDLVRREERGPINEPRVS
jgi:hypothetical protein